MPLESFFEWKSILILYFKKISKKYLNLDAYEYKIFNIDDISLVENLRRSFVTVEKNFNKYAVICKKNYFGNAKSEVSNIDFYDKINVERDPVVKKSIVYEKKRKRLFSYNIDYLVIAVCHLFIYFFFTPKFPRSPIKFRFICSTSNSAN